MTLAERLRGRTAHRCPGHNTARIDRLAQVTALNAIPTAAAVPAETSPAVLLVARELVDQLVLHADGRRERLTDRIQDGIGRGLTLADVTREIDPKPESFRTLYSRVQRTAMRLYGSAAAIDAAKQQARRKLTLIEESYEIVHAEDGDAHLIEVKMGRVTVASFRVELQLVNMQMRARVDVVKIPRQQVSLESAEAISMALAEAAMIARTLDFEHEALR